jgi:hypothetical protein
MGNSPPPQPFAGKRSRGLGPIGVPGGVHERHRGLQGQVEVLGVVHGRHGGVQGQFWEPGGGTYGYYVFQVLIGSNNQMGPFCATFHAVGVIVNIYRINLLYLSEETVRHRRERGPGRLEDSPAHVQLNNVRIRHSHKVMVREQLRIKLYVLLVTSPNCK